MGFVEFERGEDLRRNKIRESTIRTYAPASGDRLGEIRVTADEDVTAAVARARRAQEAWSRLPVAERIRRVVEFGRVLLRRSDELVEIISLECGKPRQEALLHEVGLGLELVRFYSQVGEKTLAPERLHLGIFPHRTGTNVYEPRGVVGIISPWNFPLAIPLATLIPALVAGNAVVLKPSEACPLIAQTLKTIFDSSGLPQDLLEVVYGFGDTGRALIDSGVDYVVFTGGVETGRHVGKECAFRLIPHTLELGGKAPLIACEDADIERTARAIVFGGFMNAGQACISVERVYAHRAIYDALLSRTVELTKELTMGDPKRDFSDIGAITFARQIEIANGLIADSMAKGARVLAGGKRFVGAGQFFEPTIIADCTDEMRVMSEELFSPVIPFQRVESDAEAVTLSNRSRLGLNAYVFSKDKRRAQSIAAELQVGAVVINDVQANYASVEAPFGGRKDSGYGTVHGAEALRTLSHLKHIHAPRTPLFNREAYWYPYTVRSLGWLRQVLRLWIGKSLK